MLPVGLISGVAAVGTVIVGIAARPLIENLFAGLVKTLSGLSRVGDTVLVDEEYGTVEDITATHMVVKSWDWRRYVVPNTVMLSKPAVNYTLYDGYRWAHVEFWVALDADVEKVEDIAKKAVRTSSVQWNVEDPGFWLMGMDKDGYKCWVAGWAKSPADAWQLQHEVRMNLIKGLKRAEIKGGLGYFEVRGR